MLFGHFVPELESPLRRPVALLGGPIVGPIFADRSAGTLGAAQTNSIALPNRFCYRIFIGVFPRR